MKSRHSSTRFLVILHRKLDVTFWGMIFYQNTIDALAESQSVTGLPDCRVNAKLERKNFCAPMSFKDLTNSHCWVSWSASHRFMRCSSLLMPHSDLGCQFVWLNTRDYLTPGHTYRYDNPSHRH